MKTQEQNWEPQLSKIPLSDWEEPVQADTQNKYLADIVLKGPLPNSCKEIGHERGQEL